MNILITKSARQFGYILWSGRSEQDIRNLLGNRAEVNIVFNGLSLGVKTIDWKYHRISIGYKFTRALPLTATEYCIALHKDILEVSTCNAR